MKLLPKVAVLILGYNHAHYLEDALRSVTRQSYQSDLFDTYFIDNASRDGSYELVQKNFPTITCIQHPKNLGYTGGYLPILRRVFEGGYDAAVLLNPDVVVDEHWLEELVQSGYRSPNIAFVQPKIYLWRNGPTDIFNTSGNRINYLGFGYCGSYGERDAPPILEDKEIPFASGASLLIKKEIYQKLPGIDESFFAYLEDQDLGWQARLLGYTSMLSARAKMWHKYDFRKKHLNNFKFYLLERNRLTFLLKYFERRTLLLILPAFLVMEVGILGRALLDGYFWGKMRGYGYNLRVLRAIIKKRQLMQRVRVVKDRELVSYLSSDINFLELQSLLLSIVNAFLRGYYSCIKRLL